MIFPFYSAFLPAQPKDASLGIRLDFNQHFGGGVALCNKPMLVENPDLTLKVALGAFKLL